MPQYLGNRKQGSTTHPVVFLMIDLADHISGKTGLGAAVTLTLSKDGGPFVAVTGLVSEIGSGAYAWAPNAADRSALGQLHVHALGSGADPLDFYLNIVPADPFDPTLVSPANWGLLAIDGSGHVALAQAPPANWSAQLIDGTGHVALTQAPPANWSAQLIDGTGKVTTTMTAPANFSLLAIDGSGHVSLAQAPPTNWSAQLIDGTGHVALAQAPPANWSAQLIDGAGRVTTTTTAPANFSLLAIDASGHVALGPAGLDQVQVEVGINARQALSPILAACAGNCSGLDTATATFDAGGPTGTATPRISSNIDASGNRSGTTLTLPS
jgi:hypothetical protein